MECDVEMGSARSVGRKHARAFEIKSAPLCVLAFVDLVDQLVDLEAWSAGRRYLDTQRAMPAQTNKQLIDREITCGWWVGGGDGRACIMLAVRAI